MSRVLEMSGSPTAASRSAAITRQTSIYLICGGIFLLAFCIRIVLLFVTKSYLSQEHSELVLVAISLAQGRGFANAFGNTGPTAHMSPLYPFFLSLVYRTFGLGTAGEIAQEVLSCSFASLTWALIPALGEICQLDRRIGIAAALVGATLTINRWAETKGSSEAAMAGLICLLMFMFYMKCWYARDFSLRAGVFAGILSGLAILVSATLASIVIGLLITGYIIFRKLPHWRYLRFASVAVIFVFATLFPWALRNYVVLGGLVWTRSNLPLELMVSNNDYAQPTLNHNEQSGYRYHPFMSPEQRGLVRRMGELAYQRKLKGEVLLWIRTHPQRFATLTLHRIYYFWIPEMKRPIQTVFLALLLVISVPSLIFLLKQQQLVAYGVLTMWIMYPLIYYVIQAHPRYAYPIQWTLYYLSSAGILAVFRAGKLSQPVTSHETSIA